MSMTLDSKNAPSAPEKDESLPNRTLRKALNASFGEETSDPSSYSVKTNTLRGILREKSDYSYDGELDYLLRKQVREEITNEFNFSSDEWDYRAPFTKVLVKEMYDWAQDNGLLTANIDSGGTVQKTSDLARHFSNKTAGGRLVTVNTDASRKIDCIKEIRSVLDISSGQRDRISKNLLTRMYISLFKECPEYSASRMELVEKILDGIGVENESESTRIHSNQVKQLLEEIARVESVYVGDPSYSPCPVCGKECVVTMTKLTDTENVEGVSDVCVKNTGHQIQMFEHLERDTSGEKTVDGVIEGNAEVNEGGNDSGIADVGL